MAILVLTMIAAANLDDIDPVIAGLGWAVAVSSVIALGQYFEINPFDIPHFGATGLFYNQEVLPELAAPLLVWSALRKRTILATFMFVPILLCQSRIAYAALIIGALYAWRIRWQYKASVCAIAVAVLYSVSMEMDAGKLTSLFARLVSWGVAYEALTPLGRGLGFWFASHPAPFEEYAHSDVLQLLVEIGFGAWFFFVAGVMIVWAGRGNTAERATFAVLCFESAVSFPLQLPATGFLAAVLAGYLARGRLRFRLPFVFRAIIGEEARRQSAACATRMDRAVGRDGGGIPARPAFEEFSPRHQTFPEGAA